MLSNKTVIKVYMQYLQGLAKIHDTLYIIIDTHQNRYKGEKNKRENGER